MVVDCRLARFTAGDRSRPKGDGRDYQGLAGRVLTELEVDVKSSPQKTARIARRSFDAARDDYWSAWVGQKHFGA
jgi:hypothetical protein